MSLSKIIRDDRKKRGMSMAEYAEMLCGKSIRPLFGPQIINDIEKGRRSFSPETLKKISTAIKIPANVLLWHKGVLPAWISRIEFTTEEIEEIFDFIRCVKNRR